MLYFNTNLTQSRLEEIFHYIGEEGSISDSGLDRELMDLLEADEQKKELPWGMLDPDYQSVTFRSKKKETSEAEEPVETPDPIDTEMEDQSLEQKAKTNIIQSEILYTEDETRKDDVHFWVGDVGIPDRTFPQYLCFEFNQNNISQLKKMLRVGEESGITEDRSVLLGDIDIGRNFDALLKNVMETEITAPDELDPDIASLLDDVAEEQPEATVITAKTSAKPMMKEEKESFVESIPEHVFIADPFPAIAFFDPDFSDLNVQTYFIQLGDEGQTLSKGLYIDEEETHEEGPCIRVNLAEGIFGQEGIVTKKSSRRFQKEEVAVDISINNPFPEKLRFQLHLTNTHDMEAMIRTGEEGSEHPVLDIIPAEGMFGVEGQMPTRKAKFRAPKDEEKVIEIVNPYPDVPVLNLHLTNESQIKQWIRTGEEGSEKPVLDIIPAEGMFGVEGQMPTRKAKPRVSKDEEKLIEIVNPFPDKPFINLHLTDEIQVNHLMRIGEEGSVNPVIDIVPAEGIFGQEGQAKKATTSRRRAAEQDVSFVAMNPFPDAPLKLMQGNMEHIRGILKRIGEEGTEKVDATFQIRKQAMNKKRKRLLTEEINVIITPVFPSKLRFLIDEKERKYLFQTFRFIGEEGSFSDSKKES